MRAIKLIIQYDGTNYHGWQTQPNGVTIQQILEEAVKKITGEDVKVTGAGRTDAGVHALAQVAAFKTNSKLQPDVVKRALNAVLPDDIRITDAYDIDEGFHPRYDAKSKIYFYIICSSGIISPFLHRYAWHIPYKLDYDLMVRSLDFFKGRHDFSSFRGSGCGAKNPVRTVMDISLDKTDAVEFFGIEIKESFLKLTIEADAFLRHMVRNIVGTIVETGKGKIKPQDIEKIMLSKDRRSAGPTAPAKGLFLERTKY
jgi:tRNA pseudouridine38-40 synthase